MPTRNPDIITRASELDTGLVPEPWDTRDPQSARSLVAEREQYRLEGLTDENGAGIVPAYNLNVADTGSIPSKTKDGWTRGSAGRVLNAQGQYVSRASDVPRKSFDGEDPGLLVEAAGRTNHFANSHDLTSGQEFGTGNFNSHSSILEGSFTAYSATSFRRWRFTPKNYFGSKETLSVIVERNGADTFELQFRDDNNVKTYPEYQWSDGTVDFAKNFGPNVSFQGDRKITANGPNGTEVRRLFFSVTESSSDTFQVDIIPSGSIVHHFQVEEAPNASSPIVTNGSATTRAGDSYSIFSGGQPDWWNPNGSTLLLEMRPLNYASYGTTNVFGFEGEKNGFFFFRTNYAGDQFSLDSYNNNGVTTTGKKPIFQNHKAAVSFTPNKRTVTLNGESASGSHGNTFGTTTSLTFTKRRGLSVNVKKAAYFPRALPESTLNRITA